MGDSNSNNSGAWIKRPFIKLLAASGFFLSIGSGWGWSLTNDFKTGWVVTGIAGAVLAIIGLASHLD